MVFLLCISDYADLGGVILDHGRAQVLCVEHDRTAGRDESISGLHPPPLDFYDCRFSESANMVLQKQRAACDCRYSRLLNNGICHSRPDRADKQVRLPYEGMIAIGVPT